MIRNTDFFFLPFRINVFCGPEAEKEMATGCHVVSDIYCIYCCVLIGWKYHKAYEKDQKYKEGKFIIEKAFLQKEKECKLDAKNKKKNKSAAERDDSDNSGSISSDESDSDGFPIRRTLGASQILRGIDLSRIIPNIRSEAIRLALGMR